MPSTGPSPRNAPTRGSATPPALRTTCAATGQTPDSGSSPAPQNHLTPYRRPKKGAWHHDQVFQLTNAVPTSKPDVPATREHPMFTPGHAPVRQPKGAARQTGRPNARQRKGTRKRKAPTQPQPPPKRRRKSWTREEAAALYPEFAVGTQVQLLFEFATAAGPSRWISAAGEVTYGYRVTEEHQRFKIRVKWDPATPSDQREGQTIEGLHATVHPQHRAPHRHHIHGQS